VRLKMFEANFEKMRAKQNWHDWFAWHPVFCLDGSCRWLEVVERQNIEEMGMRSMWEYQPKGMY